MSPEKAEMAPVAGVKLLPMEEQEVFLRHSIRLTLEVLDVGDALFLVDDEVVHDLEVLGFRLGPKALGVVPVGASVVHVNVEVSARPALPGKLRKRLERSELDRNRDRVRRLAHLDRPPLRPVLESLRHLDGYRSPRHRDLGAARAMEVVFLERALGADESVVRVDPGVFRSVRARVGAFDRDPRRRGDGDQEPSHRTAVPPLTRREGDALSADDLLNPDRSRAAAVGHERDPTAVGRPPWRGVVVLPVGERESVASGRRKRPELVPLPSQVRGIDDPASVGRDLEAGLPVRLLVVNLAPVGAGSRPHAKETAGTVDSSAVRNVEDLASIGRPHRAQLVVERTVVVARYGASGSRP